MRSAVICAVLAAPVVACSFTGPAGSDDGDDAIATIDAAAPPDGAPGAPDADPDTDGDTIRDAIDNCPSIPNLLQRDHDADGHGDACDRCPHLPDTADPDADGDGVGDACDPHPGAADARRMWFGFYDASEIVGWVGGSGWEVQGGALRRMSSSSSSSAETAGPPDTLSNAYVATALEITQLSGSFRRVGAAVAVSGDAQYYTCYANDDLGFWSHVYAWDWSGVLAWSSSRSIGGLAVGAQVAIVNFVDAAGAHCRISGSAFDVTAGPRGGRVVLWGDDVAAAWDYVFVVEGAD